ncbi:sensor histidine kinase [Pseudoxanthomonas composti]|uniref:histidine kinase n=1 Tax=Pseudoxanthomonas composti TaxID=2137479 RepID=A0A4Q1JR10_9GAMM|nr:ATP-binding protein [Pseudoxanthomonas composti]RXQ99712.1 two-component sensor histidine kinase [Pseudoxanthomonas composti]
MNRWHRHRHQRWHGPGRWHERCEGYHPSLKKKLLGALMGCLVVGWLITVACQYSQVSNQQNAQWDQSLREVGEQILLSLPADVGNAGRKPRLQLEHEALPPQHGPEFYKMQFQVWALDTGLGLVNSAGAPRTPFQPSMRPGYSLLTTEQEQWRVYAVSDATHRVQVQVALPRSGLRTEFLHWLKTSLLSGLGIVLLLAIAISAVVHWSFRPMQRLRAQIAAREPTDLTPLPVAGLSREVAPLVYSINELLERLSASMQGERQFLADAAHELRTPLAALLTQTHVALRAGTQADARQALEHLSHGIERTTRLAQQLLDSARVDASLRRGEDATVELADVVMMVVREFEGQAGRRQQSVAIQSDSAQVRGDLDDLGVLVRNLLDNAVRYAGQGGRIRVCCGPDESGQSTLLRVCDDGPGVPEDERERIFERFFRGSNGNGERGSGIGLSLVARIARSHGARIEAHTGLDGRGLGISVRFPRPMA